MLSSTPRKMRGEEAKIVFKNPNFWATITFLIGTALQVGGYQNQHVAWVCFATTVVLLIYGLIELAPLPGTWWSKRWAFLTLRFGGKMSLAIAAKLAYEEARVHNTLWAHAAEKMSAQQTPEGILDYVATYFGMKVALYGKRPPSDREELIDMRKKNKGEFQGGATRLVTNDSASTVFTDLKVDAKDVKSVVEVMREKVFEDGTA